MAGVGTVSQAFVFDLLAKGELEVCALATVIAPKPIKMAGAQTDFVENACAMADLITLCVKLYWSACFKKRLTNLKTLPFYGGFSLKSVRSFMTETLAATKKAVITRQMI